MRANGARTHQSTQSGFHVCEQPADSSMHLIGWFWFYMQFFRSVPFIMYNNICELCNCKEKYDSGGNKKLKFSLSTD